ncbi:hypothetical protein PCYB_003360 [Plasmodium cynomolgi strain B]|uniref:Uncharacterized protein n=1 Tax=Plasmodium cynomolgi (strain B) TaxID=1120755 RepID=K6VJK4_PLACD|nr:hypothetical protein PCYB_003360 [Plasmodium cynomolgi strain B]GAB69587.1 hypothetical protein PCYB_003360 [Plasmodium cynomolgi strain B]
MSSKGGKKKGGIFRISSGSDKVVKQQINSIFGDFASTVKGVLKGNYKDRNSFKKNCEEHITNNGVTDKVDEYVEVCVFLMEALYEIYKYKGGSTVVKYDLKEWMRCKIIRTWLSYFVKIYCIPTSIAKAIYSAMRAKMGWSNREYNMCAQGSNKVEINVTDSIMEAQVIQGKNRKNNNDFFDDVEEYSDGAKVNSGIVMIRDEIKKQKEAEKAKEEAEKAKVEAEKAKEEAEKAKEEAKKKATDTETVAVQAAKPAVTATPAPVEKGPAKTGKIRTEMKQSPRKGANSGEIGGRTRMKNSGFRFSGIGFKGSQVSNFKVRVLRTPRFPGCRTQEFLNWEPEDSGLPNPRFSDLGFRILDPGIPGFRTWGFPGFSFRNSEVPDKGVRHVWELRIPRVWT